MESYSKLNLETGFTYFILHFLVELICFSILTVRLSEFTAIIFVYLYDILAFAPQGVLGSIYEKHHKIPFGEIGVICLGIAVILSNVSSSTGFIICLIFLTLGNAILHSLAAIDTVANSESKIFASALFVGGGSFGVCAGKFWNLTVLNLYWLIIPVILAYLLVHRANSFRPEGFKLPGYKHPEFDITISTSVYVIVFIVLFTTAIRGYVGYAIPTEWCNTPLETCLLYFSMGIGKIVGGYSCDKFGYKPTAIITTLGSIPFLIFGNNNIFISIFGILLFSMTMSISFAIGLSAIKESTAVPFGLTTIGLLIGSLSYFIFKPSEDMSNALIIFASVACCVLFVKVLNRKTERVQ